MDKIKKILLFLVIISLFSGCSSFFPQVGPTTHSILHSSNPYITLVELNPQLTSIFQQFVNNYETQIEYFFSKKYVPVIGTGDILEITIYETPPAVLFNVAIISGSGSTQGFAVPPQIVDDEGYITVPFIGRVLAKGKRPEELGEEIRKHLINKANNPYVVVKILSFNSSYVSVFGEVRESRKVPLTYTNTTLIDVLSSVGGVTSPVNKTLVQIDRNGQKLVIPLELVIKNPRYNINLAPGDIVTVYYKSQNAVFLGATEKNVDLEFEALGISLAQALGRVGGLKEDVAHAKGVFIFRFEDREILEKADISYKAYTKKDEKVPVVYTVDMTKPESLFVLKNFTLKDGDIVYIATAPSVQLHRFLSFVSSAIQPVFMIERMSRR